MLVLAAQHDDAQRLVSVVLSSPLGVFFFFSCSSSIANNFGHTSERDDVDMHTVMRDRQTCMEYRE